MEGALDTSMSTAGCSQDQQGIADFVTTNSLYTGALDQSMHQDEHVLRERRRLLALDSVKVDIQRKESIINTLQQRIHSLESDILKSNEIIKETHRQWAEEQDQLVDEKASLQKRFEEKEIEHEIERTNLNQFIGKLQDELRDYRETTGAKIFLLDGENSSMRSQVASLQEQIRGIEDDHKKTRNQLKKSKEAFVDTEKNQLEANRSLAEMNILLERTTKELQAASKESKKQIKAAEKWKLSYQKLEESAKVAFENAASKHGRMMDSAKRDISRYKQQETSMKKVLGKVLSAVSAPLTDLNLTLGDNDKDTEHNDENDVNAASRIQQLCIVMNKLSEFLTTLSEEGDSGDEAPTASKAKKPVNLFVNVLISLLSRLTSSLQSRAKLEDLSSNATNAIKVAQLMMTKQETRMSNAMHFVHGITKLAADMSKELQDCQLSLQPDAPFREGTRSPHIRSKNGDGIEPKHGVFSPLSNRSASASPKRSERGFASKTPSPQRSQLQKAMQSPIRPHSASDPLPTSPWMSPTNWTFITELGENFMHGVDVAEASMGRGEDASVVRMQYCQSAIDTLRAHMQEVIQGASRCHRNYYELNTAYEDLQLRYERLQDTQAKETAENDKLLGDISADLNECKEKYMKEQDRFDALKKWSKQEISAANLLLKKAKCRDDAQMKDRESLLKQLSLVQDTYQQTIDRLQTELDDVRSHYESFIGDMQKTHKIAMKDQREEYRAKLAVHGAAHDERVRKEVIDQRLTNQEIIHQQEMTLLQERYETEMSVALKEAILRKNVTGTQQQDDDLENEKCHEEVIAHLQCWVQHLIYSGLVKSQTLYELATQKSYLAQVVHRYEMLRCDVQAVYEGCFMSLSTGSINNLEHVDTHADLLQRGDIYETSRRTRTPHELEMFHDQRKSPVRRLPGLSAYQKRTTIPTLRVVAIAILVARRFENVLKDMRCPPDELDFLGAMAVGQYSVTKGRPLDTLPRPHMPMLKSDGYFHIPDVEILNTLPTESGAEIILDASMKQLCEEIMHSPQRKERFMYAHPLLGHDRLEMHGRSLLRTVASASNRYSASDTPCGTSQMSLRRPFWYEQRPARSYFGGDQIHGICVTLESMSRALREHSDNDAALKSQLQSVEADLKESEASGRELRALLAKQVELAERKDQQDRPALSHTHSTRNANSNHVHKPSRSHHISNHYEEPTSSFLSHSTNRPHHERVRPPTSGAASPRRILSPRSQSPQLQRSMSQRPMSHAYSPKQTITKSESAEAVRAAKEVLERLAEEEGTKYTAATDSPLVPRVVHAASAERPAKAAKNMVVDNMTHIAGYGYGHGYRHGLASERETVFQDLVSVAPSVMSSLATSPRVLSRVNTTHTTPLSTHFAIHDNMPPKHMDTGLSQYQHHRTLERHGSGRSHVSDTHSHESKGSLDYYIGMRMSGH